MKFTSGLSETEDGTPIREAVQLIEDLMVDLDDQLSELDDRQGVDKGLERAAVSVKMEKEQLRRHLEKGDDMQAVASMKRLLQKIVRFQRRIGG